MKKELTYEELKKAYQRLKEEDNSLSTEYDELNAKYKELLEKYKDLIQKNITLNISLKEVLEFMQNNVLTKKATNLSNEHQMENRNKN